MTEIKQEAIIARKKGRYLSDPFFKDLEQGFLTPLLHQAQKDNSLCFQIRDNYINIYYRGGSLLKITAEGTYNASFNWNYFGPVSIPKNRPSPKLTTEEDVRKWIALFPMLKEAMDRRFTKSPKLEREAQQRLVLENNTGKGAQSTDYFICDIEYAESDARYDMIAVKWPSTKDSRRNSRCPTLAFIEMKYLDRALAKKCGIKDHLEHITPFFENPDNILRVKKEMLNVFKKLQKYGFIGAKKILEDIDIKSKPEYIFILANHDPTYSTLRTELEDIPSSFKNFDLKFAVSNFMGYILYEKNMFNKDEFLKKFEGHI